MDRILIIDDDDLMLSVLGEVLESAGYEVAKANSGERGIKLFCRLAPALVITDLIMPHTDGVHVIEEIRRRSASVRIIAISGTPRIETMGDAVHAEANRVIAKPFDQDEILDAVAEMLQYAVKTA